MAYNPSGDRNYLNALRRVMQKSWFGQDSTAAQAPIILAGENIIGLNASQTGTVPIIGLVNDLPVLPASTTIGANAIIGPNALIGGQIQNTAMAKTVNFQITLNADVGTTSFFIADRAYTITGITYVHKTAGTVAGAACSVTKDPSGTAPGAGSALQSGIFDCQATATNTVLTATLTATTANLTMAAGDTLSVLFAGTLTTLAGVQITVTMTPCGVSETAQYYCRVNGSIATQSFFQANRAMTITGVRIRYATAFAAAVTINVMKDTGTTAAGGGTSVLTAAAAGDGTANTVLSPALAASAATLSMAAGDRLSVKFSATTTGAGVLVEVLFAPILDRAEISWQLAANAQQQVAQYFFTADRTYELVDASCIFDVAAGGVATIAITIDRGTTAPGAGDIVQTDNTNAGFNLNATARTTQFMTPATLHLRLLNPGDRLGLKVAGAAQSISLVAITASLRPRF